MEHIYIKDFGNGLYKLTPESGYRLYNRFLNKYHSEAVTNNPNQYKAVMSGQPVPPSPSDPLARAKTQKIADLGRYDSSGAVNGIIVGGVELWIPAEQRAILRTSIDAYKALGETNVTKVWEGVEYTFGVDVWLYMINTVEVYASECFNTTARHKAAINALDSVEAVEAYDFTTGYPPKPTFSL